MTDSPVKITLFDLAKVGPNCMDRDAGKKVVKSLSEKLTKDDLKYVFFFLKDDIGLIENGYSNAAIINMITIVENCLRNEYYSRVKTTPLPKKDVEELCLDELRAGLKPFLSTELNNKICELNKVRAIFIHKNMKKGGKYVLENIPVEGYINPTNPVQKREVFRSILYSASGPIAEKIFLISLEIVKGLYPEHAGRISDENFANLVNSALNPNPVLFG